MKLQNYHENLGIFSVGAMPQRAWYLPAANAEEALASKSSRCFMLSGTWGFAYYRNPRAVPEGAVAPGFARGGFSDIPVPSAWQMEGYGRHQYTNIRYPFPYDPPYVPDENPCGLYVREFRLEKKRAGYRYHLNFEGVDSCFYLYIGGRFAGYGQVSHATNEFDVTGLLEQGDNHIAVLALQWCDGSYLEDQDKLRMSGIFRDVYILERPESHIRDFFVHARPNGSYADIEAVLEYAGCPEVRATLLSPGGERLGASGAMAGKVSFRVHGPKLWSAESPALYTLLLESGGECIAQRVGIRRVEAVGGAILLNGVPLRLNGVNLHDSDPFTGCAVSREQALRDLALMKRHNINAIRTSHYPHAPWFVQMCDEHGFYVIAEADLECHGVTALYGAIDGESFDLLARDPKFAPAMLDRVQRCVIRDKNSPSVLFWSLGNEAGYGPAFEEAGRWARAYDPSRLLHYEGASHESPGNKNDTSMLDVHSRMYASPEEIEGYFSGEGPAKPFVLCEYSHAMGNGPGDGEGYFALMEKHPGFCGGFVWEWCDHAVYMGKTPAGRERYFYGGDFGEFPHDGNFCLDGLVYPDRRPHTGLLEFKNIFRPVRAELLAGGKVRFKNMRRFTASGELLTAEFEVTRNGEPVEKGVFPLDIPPMGIADIHPGYTLPESGKCFLNIYYRQKKGAPLIPEGYPLGFDQLLLREGAPAFTRETGSVSVEDGDCAATVTGEGFRYVFNKLTGLFDELAYGGRSLLERPMEWNIWRAPTDNDRYIRLEWEKAGYDRHTAKVYRTGADIRDGCAVFWAELSLAAIHIQRILELRAEWVVGAGGGLEANVHVRRNAAMPYLPRFGLRLFLPRAFDSLDYLGYGPCESYADKRQAAFYGRFRSDVAAPPEDSLRPQEHGSHWGCDLVRLEDGVGHCLCVESESPFCFNVSPYTQEELAAKAHNYELAPCGDTVLCVDFAQSGIGSNSCGPELAERFRLSDEEFRFLIRFRPKAGT
jgi:beta-galactosidase